MIVETQNEVGSKTAADLGWNVILDALSARCHTTLGAALARDLKPLSISEARQRLIETAEARFLRGQGQSLSFGGITDIRAALARVGRAGVLDAKELCDTARTVRGCAELRRQLLTHVQTAPNLARLAADLAELAHVHGPILDAFDDGGRLVDHASAALGPLRKRALSLHDELKRKIRTLIEGPELSDVLQDHFYTQRGDRYVVPVRADAHRRVRGIVHGTSGSGATIFIEPEAIVDLNNRIKLSEAEIFDEEARIYAQLSAYVAEEVETIARELTVAADLDLIDGAARLADALDATAPKIAPAGEFQLKNARHPLIVLSGVECIASDVVLPAEQSLIITGPNAGGKTVALKMVGLICLMTRHGLMVPADDGAIVPWFQIVLTDMGDDQSIERNLSTFSAHVMYLRDALSQASPETLLLIDEIAVGTDPGQGAALAQAVLETLAGRGARTFVTTHYERLKGLASQDLRFQNASVGFDLESMTPTYRLHIGLPGSSGALAVARRLKLDASVCDRAELLLGDRAQSVEALISDLAKTQAALDREAQTLRHERTEVESLRNEAAAALALAESRARAAKRSEHDSAVATLRETRFELDRVRAEIKKSRAVDLRAVDDQIDSAARKIAEQAPAKEEPLGRVARADELVAGAQVLIDGLGPAVVMGTPEKGRVQVRMGILRTSIPIEEVRIAASTKETGRVSAQKKSAFSAGKNTGGGKIGSESSAGGNFQAQADDLFVRTSATTLDLRGQRVDAGLSEIDKFVDDALLSGRDAVCVLHGHGTGALRDAVRSHVSAHHAVTRYRPGHPSEGGDGVTIMWLV